MRLVRSIVQTEVLFGVNLLKINISRNENIQKLCLKVGVFRRSLAEDVDKILLFYILIHNSLIIWVFVKQSDGQLIEVNINSIH